MVSSPCFSNGGGVLKFNYKLRLNQTVKAKCERHPLYDPSTAGKDYINDRCATCKDILDLYESKLSVEKAVKNFERRAGFWQASKRLAKAATTPVSAESK
jgi:hypothetical protein